MAESDKGDGASTHSNGPDTETLPGLVGRLGDDLSKLFDLRLSLLKVEIKEDVDAYIHRSIVIGAGGLVVLVGFALLNVAVAFFLSTLFAGTGLSQPARYGLGFLVTGALSLVIGAIVVVVTKDRLARQGLIPKRSIAELENDREMVRTVIHG